MTLPLSEPARGASTATAPVGESGLGTGRGVACLSRRSALAVFAAALLAQGWLLGLSFQLDDFGLLISPFTYLDLERVEAMGNSGRMMRWPFLLFLGTLRLLLPEPLSPVPFHVWSLLQHATFAFLLARTVSRFEASAGCPRAGLFAGLAFGLAGGHVQAVSWTAAGASLMYPLLALLSLDAFLEARVSGSRAGRRRRMAAVWMYASLVCKAPAVVGFAAVGLLLLGTSHAWRGGERGRRGRRRLWAEGWTLVLAGGLAALSRYLYMGSLELSYYDRATPGVLGALARVPNGLRAVGQALVPWNATPLLEGLEPLSVSLLGRSWSAPALAAALFLPWVVLAFLVGARLRGALVLCLGAVVVCALPPGLLYGDHPSNLVSRTTYLPMGVAAAVLGLVAAGLGARRRVLGALALLWFALSSLDGTVHVARTELAADAQRRAALAHLREVVAEHERSGSPRELVILAIVGDSGFGGIPQLGKRVADAARPPFLEPPGWDVRAFTSRRAIHERIDELGLTYADVAVVGPALDEEGEPPLESPELGGADLRALREWRTHSAPFPAAPAAAEPGAASGGARLLPSFTRVEGPGPGGDARWEAHPPMPAHAMRVVLLETDGGAVLQGDLIVERAGGDELRFPVECGGGAGGGLALELPLTTSQLFGPPWRALRWESAGELGPHAIEPIEHLPAIEVLGLPGGDELSVDAGRIPRPRFLFRMPAGVPGRMARLTWRIETRNRTLSFHADAGVSIEDGVFEFLPRGVTLRGAPPKTFPWGEFCRRFLGPPLRTGLVEEIVLDCHLEMRLDGDLTTARSPAFSLRFTG